MIILKKSNNNPFSKVKKSPYDPAFVKKILKGRKDSEEGKGRKLSLDELDTL